MLPKNDQNMYFPGFYRLFDVKFHQKSGKISKLHVKNMYLHKNSGPSNEYVITKGSTYIADKDNPPHAQAIENVPHFAILLLKLLVLFNYFSNKLSVKSNVGTEDRSKLENRWNFYSVKLTTYNH